jgi:hypothetical protein
MTEHGTAVMEVKKIHFPTRFDLAIWAARAWVPGLFHTLHSGRLQPMIRT